MRFILFPSKKKKKGYCMLRLYTSTDLDPEELLFKGEKEENSFVSFSAKEGLIFYFILFYFILFYFILFYLFYFILFYLFYFILFYLFFFWFYL